MASSDFSIADRQARLQQVLALSKTMVEHAGRGEWERIVELEQQRRTDMMQALSEPLVEDETGQVRDSLQQLMTLNGQLAEIVRKARDQSVAQYNTLRDGRTATRAYQQIGAHK